MNAREFFQAVNSKMRGWGYNVEEQEGCWARSNGVGWAQGVPVAHTNHHFVIRLSAPFEDGARNVTYGDKTLSGPKCNYYGALDATTGKQRLRLISAGTANHPGQGRREVYNRMMAGQAPLGWVAEKYSPVADNWGGASGVYCGTEWHHPGDATPWPEPLLAMIVDLNAAMCIVAGWNPNRCHQHAEHSARKIDMSYLRGQGGHEIRRRTAIRIGGGSIPVPEPVPVDSEEDEDMLKVLRNPGGVNHAYGPGFYRRIANEDEYGFFKAAGLIPNVPSNQTPQSADNLIKFVEEQVRQNQIAALVEAGIVDKGELRAVLRAPEFGVPATSTRSGQILTQAQANYNAIGAVMAKLNEDDPASPIPEPETYTVVGGDTLTKISVATGKSVADLILWNKLPSGDAIDVGQVLRLNP